jgi:hypothetical protein
MYVGPGNVRLKMIPGELQMKEFDAKEYAQRVGMAESPAHVEEYFAEIKQMSPDLQKTVIDLLEAELVEDTKSGLPSVAS